MKDERIQTTVNRFAAIGFFIWFFLISISLFCRTMVLKQHPREFWDIFAIWVIGIFFVFISFSKKGVFDYGFRKFWLRIFAIIFIVNFALFFIMGLFDSVVDVVGYLIGFLVGMISVISIAYFLTQRWKRKEGIEEES